MDMQTHLKRMKEDLTERFTIPHIKRRVWYNALGKKKCQTGILLVHGFSGTPKEMSDCGVKLAKRGYRCLAITLSGHGDCAENLKDVKVEDWVEDLLKGGRASEKRRV